jgi:hypothetical protein
MWAVRYDATNEEAKLRDDYINYGLAANNPSTAHYTYADIMSGKPRSNEWYWGGDAVYRDNVEGKWVVDTIGGAPSWYVNARATTPAGAWFIPGSRGEKPVVFQGNWPSGSLVAPSANAQYFYTRGYGIVTSASLGNAFNEPNSEGFTNCGDIEETLVVMAIIKWLNGDPGVKGYTSREATTEVVATWCNGSVAMTGASYDGTLPNAAAASGVEGLKAILPVAAISDWYYYYRANGAVVAPGGYQGEDADELTDYTFGRRGTVEFRAGDLNDAQTAVRNPREGVALLFEKYPNLSVYPERVLAMVQASCWGIHFPARCNHHTICPKLPQYA